MKKEPIRDIGIIFGDLSMSLEQTLWSPALTVPLSGGNIKRLYHQLKRVVPIRRASIFGAELFFNNDYFDPNSRTSAI
ncbi:MAG: hypothetical protein IPK25_09360 [Saprospiraceae bacterium]|nr:hypothetical protein [Saprospiraceae bacterium]